MSSLKSNCMIFNFTLYTTTCIHFSEFVFIYCLLLINLIISKNNVT